MAAKIIDGKKIAEEIQEELTSEVSKLKENGIVPGLAIILVGEESASQVYVRNKSTACKKIGILCNRKGIGEAVNVESCVAEYMVKQKYLHGD